MKSHNLMLSEGGTGISNIMEWILSDVRKAVCEFNNPNLIIKQGSIGDHKFSHSIHWLSDDSFPQQFWDVLRKYTQK